MQPGPSRDASHEATSLAAVAGPLAPLLAAVAAPVYLYGATVTQGGTRWAMLLFGLILASSLWMLKRPPTPLEMKVGSALGPAAIVLWSVAAPDETAARALLILVMTVHSGLMLPRPAAEISLVACVLGYAGFDLVSGPMAKQQQVATIAFTALCVGVLMLGIRRTTEQRVHAQMTALAAANDQLEALNRTDPLTGLANRRQLDRTAEDLRGDHDGPVSAIMVDIDFFKQYNDRFGHLGGDDCLRKVAAALTAHVRDSDVVARYGGEEFAVIMPDTDLATASGIAERIRDAVAGLAQDHPAAPAGHLTVSLGVACENPGETVADLIRRADDNLYAAKNLGRDRVVADQLTAPLSGSRG
jgi:diguanylate cyclase (GGDEF)-like protein